MNHDVTENNINWIQRRAGIIIWRRKFVIRQLQYTIPFKLENLKRIWTSRSLNNTYYTFNRIAHRRHPILTNNPNCLNKTGFYTFPVVKNVNRPNTDENINGKKCAWCVTFVILYGYSFVLPSYATVKTVACTQ